jgi:hypothetical protein
MKSLHKPGLFTWSEFNADRNIDFNSFFPKGSPIMSALNPFLTGEIENVVIGSLNSFKQKKPLSLAVTLDH